jgi:hypothetical protein
MQGDYFFVFRGDSPKRPRDFERLGGAPLRGAHWRTKAFLALLFSCSELSSIKALIVSLLIILINLFLYYKSNTTLIIAKGKYPGHNVRGIKIVE